MSADLIRRPECPIGRHIVAGTIPRTHAFGLIGSMVAHDRPIR
jgi:hypothetical protein